MPAAMAEITRRPVWMLLKNSIDHGVRRRTEKNLAGREMDRQSFVVAGGGEQERLERVKVVCLLV